MKHRSLLKTRNVKNLALNQFFLKKGSTSMDAEVSFVKVCFVFTYTRCNNVGIQRFHDGMGCRRVIQFLSMCK